eukprot:12306444-Karenia_brevis.AAC.1
MIQASTLNTKQRAAMCKSIAAHPPPEYAFERGCGCPKRMCVIHVFTWFQPVSLLQIDFGKVCRE